MWQGFAIALREGIESFLIVALMVAYLRRTGRRSLVRAVASGIAAAGALCLAAGWALRSAANRPLWEALLAVVTAFLVGSLLVWMGFVGKEIHSRLERQLDRAAARPRYAFVAVAALTGFLITREGMEIALLVIGAIEQVPAPELLVGLVVGTAAAAGIGVTWVRLGRRVRIGVLMTVLTVFLAIFLVQIVLYAVHELAEARLVPNAPVVHDATEALGPEGPIGHALSYLLAAVPSIWLVSAWLRSRAVPLSPPRRSPAR